MTVSCKIEEEHIVIFDAHYKGCSKQEQVAGDKSTGWAVGAGAVSTGAGAGTRAGAVSTGAGAEAEATLAAEAGDTLTFSSPT